MIITSRWFARVASIAGLAVIAFIVGIAVAAQVPVDRLLRASDEPQNWLTYSGTYFSQRFSTLTQITTENVRQLQLQWVYQAQSDEPSNSKFEATPLVVDGVMYTVRPPMTLWRSTPLPVKCDGQRCTSRPRLRVLAVAVSTVDSRF